MQFSKLEEKIKYNFKNNNLLKEALTHRSYINENRSWKFSHNERLEFLGDAVLELIVTEELFHRFPEKSEGKLTPLRAALVNYQMLARVALSFNLEKFVLLSRGEAKDNGRGKEVVLANATEALIGAIYLDSGYDAAKKFINNFVVVFLGEILREGLQSDAKSLLQEKMQASEKITPVYKVLEQSGPEHQKVFKVGVYSGKKMIASGEGRSKQEAELDAAKKALSTGMR